MIVKDFSHNNCLEEIVKFLEVKHISHLDEISARVIAWSFRFLKRVGLVNSDNTYDVLELKDKLVKLGIFSPKVEDYSIDIRRAIIESNLDTRTNSKYYYTSRDKLDADTFKANISIIISEFLRREHILHLDDLGIDHYNKENYFKGGLVRKYNGLWQRLGIQTKIKGRVGREIDLKYLFVQLKIFPSLIKKYEKDIQEDIIERILNPGGMYDTYYLHNSLPQYIFKKNLGLVIGKLRAREKIEHIDNLGTSIVRKYKYFFNLIAGSDSDLPIDEYRVLMVKLGLFSEQIRDYREDVIKNIINKTLRMGRGGDPFYISDKVSKIIRKENIKVTLEALIKKNSLTTVNVISNDICLYYRGYFNHLHYFFTKRKKTARSKHLFLKTTIVKSFMVYLGYFHDDVEKKYSKIKQKGTVVDLLKKLDIELFGYKNIHYKEEQVDQLSFSIFKGIKAQSKEIGIRPSCALDLFDYYIKTYAKR